MADHPFRTDVRELSTHELAARLVAVAKDLTAAVDELEASTVALEEVVRETRPPEPHLTLVAPVVDDA
jgi:hypothetical protein